MRRSKTLLVSTALAVLPALLSALPALAQDRGGLRLTSSSVTLGEIEANQGCPLSSTSVTVGLNKAMGTRSSAQQQLGTTSPSPTKCRPLISTQVVAGVNLAVGQSSNAGQSISAQGQRGVLATDTYTRGYNIGYGALSTATQRLSNQTH
jgi:hypothetical protein